MTGIRTVRCEDLVSLARLFKCPDCDSRSLSADEDIATRRGLSSRIAFRCAACGWFHYLSDSYDSQQTLVNNRSVLAARMIGKGHQSLDTFCGMMDLPPPVTSRAHTECAKKILRATEEAVRVQSISAAKELHEMSAKGTLFVPPPIANVDENPFHPADEGGVGDEDETSPAADGDGQSYDDIPLNLDQDDDGHQDQNPNGLQDQNPDGQQGDDQGDQSSGRVDSDEIHHGNDDQYPPVGWEGEPMDVTVTFDGTWMKRGFVSNYGVLVVISWDTGRVLDTIVLSKYCAKCSRMRGMHCMS